MLRVLRRDLVQLRQIPRLDALVGDVAQPHGGIPVQMRAGVLVHDAAVELARLVVLGLLGLVVVVRLAGDGVVGDFVGRLGDVWSELVEATIGDVRGLATVVGVATELAVEVWGVDCAGHEGAVYWKGG